MVDPDAQPVIPEGNPEDEANPPPPQQHPHIFDIGDGGLFLNPPLTEDVVFYAQAPLDQLRTCLKNLYSQINNFKLLIRMSAVQENDDEEVKKAELHPFVQLGAFDLIISLLNKYVDDAETFEHVVFNADYLVRAMAFSTQILGIVNPLLHAIVIHTDQKIRARATHLLWFLT